MSSVLHFLIETYAIDHWTALDPEVGIIQGFRPNSIEAALFFSEQALFKLMPGHPQDLSETYRQDTLIENVIDTPWCGWINLEALYLPLWTQETVLLWGWTSPEQAALFQQGTLFEPNELLARTQIRPRGLSPHPIDLTATYPSSDWVKVSWEVSLATLAKPMWEGLKVYTHHKNPENIRVITGLG